MAHLEVTTTAAVAGGASLARDGDGRVVFVEGALPGERVRVEIVERKRDFTRAIAVEIVEASPDRVMPPCAARTSGCGGCGWQHVAQEAQSRLKADLVGDALRRIARLDTPPPITVASSSARPLRTTTRLGVDAAGRAGLRRRGSRDVVTTDACHAAHPLLEELIVDGRYPGATDVLLRVGVASGERLALPWPAATRPSVPADVVVATPGETAALHEDVAGRRFRISVDSFFQSGPDAAAALVTAVDDAVAGALPPDGHLLDLYAGVGLFASTIGAGRGVSVTAVEQAASAVADARANLADLDASVVQAEVGRWRPAVRIDVAVADPARPGLGRPGVATVVATAAPRLVLVGCDPASFARDAALLRAEGYDLAAITLVDAFPDTFHVETVGRFDLR